MYKYETRVRFSETDPDGNMTVTAIIDHFQDIATFHSEDVGAGRKVLGKRNMAWVICSWQLEILRCPVFGEKITIATKAFSFRAFTGSRNCMILNEQGEILVRAACIWAMMDMVKGKPVNVPEDIIEKYEVEEPLDMEYLPRKIILPREGGEALERFTIQRSHIDSLGHVNNGQYIKMAAALCGNEMPSLLRAEYKMQAHPGDVFCPVRYSLEDGEIISFFDTEGRVYASVQFYK